MYHDYKIFNADCIWAFLHLVVVGCVAAVSEELV
jgi:hypothetical protein